MKRKPYMVVVATYNECNNLEKLVRCILKCHDDMDVLVVDDNSPDGTGRIANDLTKVFAGVKVLHRKERQGLALALCAGFAYASSCGYKRIINMDADWSHSPFDIKKLLGSSADLVIGSRYIGGMRTRNWNVGRLALSKVAGRCIRWGTRLPIADPTSGFRSFSSDAIKQILCVPLLSKGYSFHFEVAHRVWAAGKSVVEVPIVYTGRTAGQSKLTVGILWEAVSVLVRLTCGAYRDHKGHVAINGRALPC